jgi:predicted nucleic acid-binding protein
MTAPAGVAAARQQGFRVTGTLGVLADAAREGLLDLAAAFAALRATSFRHAPALLDALLAEERARRDGPKRGDR